MHFPLFWAPRAALEVLERLCVGMIVRPYTTDLRVVRLLDKPPFYINAFVLIHSNGSFAGMHMANAPCNI